MSDIPAEVVLRDDPCPMGCARSDQRVLSARDRMHDLPGEFNIVRCNHCHLMRTNPRPAPESIGYYYPADYGPYHLPKPQPRRGVSEQRSLRRQQTIGLYEARALPLSPPGRLLEIGCANGAFMLEAQALGWQVEGIEFSPTVAARARESGLDVRSGSIEDFATPEQPYDLLVGWMVFEHVHNPLETFRSLSRWVRPDGWLALSVPDAASLEFRLFRQRWYALQVPTHMSHFTASTLRELLARAGWKMEKVFWQQNPNNLFNSLHYWALDRDHRRLAQLMLDIVAGKRWRRLHRFLSRLLAITHQSGRMTVWARRAPQ